MALPSWACASRCSAGGAADHQGALSFLVLPAVLVATAALGEAKASYFTVVVTRLAITVAAFGASLLIPKPVEAKVAE